MKKFARCVLILILVTMISGVCGYFYEDKTLISMYTSTAQLYVVPGEENEATIRADNGGLKDDFVIIFKSGVVIQEAQKIAGTSEDIAQYLTVSSPANSNIVEIICTNPDQNTAKQYVDAVAKTALKTTSIIPVKSIQILSEGSADNVPVKPNLYRNTFMIMAVGAGACLALELIVVLVMCAFKKPEDHSDDEFEYEKYYGKYAAALNSQPPSFIGTEKERQKSEPEEKKNSHKKKEEAPSDMRDILEDFDEDYAEDEELYDIDDEISSAYKDAAVSDEIEASGEDSVEEVIEESQDDIQIPGSMIEPEIEDSQQEVLKDTMDKQIETFTEEALEEQVAAELEGEEAEPEPKQEAECIEEEMVEGTMEPEREQTEQLAKLQSSAQVLGIIKK